ncbi:MAG: 50S ribosomal protein L19 [Candidatus Omnitrophota bacterium]
MSRVIQEIEDEQKKKEVQSFNIGDTVRIYVKIVEEEKTRIQAFEGTVIARHNRGIKSTFTVRRISYGEGVERIFPLYSPNLDRIEVIKKGKVRRAKLYYLRERVGKRARVA